MQLCSSLSSVQDVDIQRQLLPTGLSLEAAGLQDLLAELVVHTLGLVPAGSNTCGSLCCSSQGM